MLNFSFKSLENLVKSGFTRLPTLLTRRLLQGHFPNFAIVTIYASSHGFHVRDNYQEPLASREHLFRCVCQSRPIYCCKPSTNAIHVRYSIRYKAIMVEREVSIKLDGNKNWHTESYRLHKHVFFFSENARQEKM